jgi:hypothetical protein
MQGAQALTPEMDVYAFSICCVEILTKGALPWPLMDDDAVRRFVLSAYPVHSLSLISTLRVSVTLVSPAENMRPSLPPSHLTSGPLMDTIRSSWDPLPSNRPSFEQIARDMKKLRAGRSAQSLHALVGDSPKPTPILDQWEAQNPYHHPHHRSPDILPQPLPDDESSTRSQDPTTFPFASNNGESGHSGSALGLEVGNDTTGLLWMHPWQKEELTRLPQSIRDLAQYHRTLSRRMQAPLRQTFSLPWHTMILPHCIRTSDGTECSCSTITTPSVGLSFSFTVGAALLLTHTRCAKLRFRYGTPLTLNSAQWASCRSRKVVLRHCSMPLIPE